MTTEMVERADQVITMGCSLPNGPVSDAESIVDWGLEDPKGRDIDDVRTVRDHVEARIRRLLADV